MKNTKKIWGFLTLLTFWGYNLLYLLLGVVVVYTLIREIFLYKVPVLEILTLGGLFPAHVLALVYVTVALPVVILGIGFLPRFRYDRAKLATLFFGLEIPLMGLLILRILFLRQLNPSVFLLLSGIGVSLVGLGLYLWHSRIRHLVVAWFVLISQQIALTIAGYAAALAFFFMPIFLAFFIDMLSQFRWSVFFRNIWRSFQYGDLGDFLWIILGLTVFFSTIGFLVTSPFAAVTAFWKIAQATASQLRDHFKISHAQIKLVRLLTTLVFLGAVMLASWQQRRHSYDQLLQDFIAASSFEEQQQIALSIEQRQAAIKDSLFAMYTSPYRYLTDNQISLLQMGYENELGWTQERAQQIQGLFNTVALPFLYGGSFDEDVQQAAEWYRLVFDAHIQAGERDKLISTLKATNVQDGLKAGILDESDEDVLLVSKVVSVNTEADGLLATVIVEEEYENQSDQQQEVFYEFSLPEDSVLTGLALGPKLEFGSLAAEGQTQVPEGRPVEPSTSAGASPTTVLASDEQADQGVVAPKGAAEQTYNNQLVRRVDPALLQQTGPRQYKLRVFPIPVERDNGETQNQKVRYTYVTLNTGQGFALPTISTSRNVFQSRKTTTRYLVDGQEIDAFSSNSQVVPFAMTAGSDLVAQTNRGQIVFKPTSFELNWSILQGQRIALLFDTSASVEGDWQATVLPTILEHELLDSNQFEYYYFTTQMSPVHQLGTDPLKPVINLGGTDRLAAIKAVSDQDYDAIFLLTDDDVQEQSQATPDRLVTDTPLYVVHSQGAIPTYQDVLSESLIQSRAEVISSFEEALELHLLKASTVSQDEELQILDVTPQGVWLITPELSGVSSSPTFETLGYYKVIMEEVANTTLLSDLSFLDELNVLAQHRGIVTPYSSLIALVNDQQRRELEQRMQQDDRYAVEFDYGQENLADPSGTQILTTSAVPEPHEWLLIIASGLLLSWYYRHQLLARLVSL